MSTQHKRYHASDLNIEPRQQDLVLTTEQLEQDDNPVTLRHAGVEGETVAKRPS
jgi:hypothetical protein